MMKLFLPLGVTLLALVSALSQGQDQPPRAARSVHLGYQAPDGDAYYNEMVIEQSVPGSYFMACGWDTGYFGLQQLGDGERKVVLFSVWDPTRGNNPEAVKEADRVEVLYQGEGVRIKRFGGEGTGGQCMAPLAWKLGETNCFLVRAEVQGEHTAYTAFVRAGATNAWWKLATFRTRTGGRPLRGYHSFVEDFRRDFKSVEQTRRAAYGIGWVRTTQGKWVGLDNARFTASHATWESLDNIDAGTAGGRFYLATGGAITAHTKLNDLARLPAPPPSPPELNALLGVVP
jgi:hypothetical protein